MDILLNLHCQKCKNVIEKVSPIFEIEIEEITENTHLVCNFCAKCLEGNEDIIDNDEYEEWISNEIIYIENPNELSLFKV